MNRITRYGGYGFQFLYLIHYLVFCIMGSSSLATERQVTSAPYGHILTNINVWSPDSQWIVYDIRSDSAGEMFDGNRIERVHVRTGEVEVLYESHRGAHCGVATYNCQKEEVIFIHGPEEPTDDWSYSAYHRRGVVVATNTPRTATTLDARNIAAPFTAGALRGGTHVHTSSGDGEWIAFTYEDHVLATANQSSADKNQRNVGVSVPVRAVDVPDTHFRNHNGSHFSVLVTRTANDPRPGSNEISKAFSDAWIGTNGYIRGDGTRQEKAIAFQGHVRTGQGETIAEVFVVDIPEDVTRPSADGPLEGTSTRRPLPPFGAIQRRITFTDDRQHPGIDGVRHWLRSSPDGAQIAFLMKDDFGVSQLWTVSPNGGELCQITHNDHDVSSAFSWSPDGKAIAHTMNESVCVTKIKSRETSRLTQPNPGAPLRPEACVFSPDGKQVAYVRRVASNGETWNQIFVTAVNDE